MEKQVQEHLIDYMNKVVSHFAYQDMLKAQGKNRNKRAKIKPYSLSDDTLEAKEFLNKAHAGTDEEGIKAYMLKLRITRDINL